jgi:hypothetical protein
MQLQMMQLSMHAGQLQKKESLQEFHLVQLCGQQLRLQSDQSMQVKTLLLSVHHLVNATYRRFFTKI